MKYHPVAEIFPMMSANDICLLSNDIKANGLHEPIWLDREGGEIVDGRNRYEACQVAGVKPSYRVWDGVGSLVSFVVGLNLHRRHLSESQRAMVAAKIATLSQGRPNKAANLPVITQGDASNLLGVSERSIRTAKSVIEAGTEELIEAVDQGLVSVSAAADISGEMGDVQREIVAKTKPEIKEEVAKIRDRTAALRSSESNEWYTPVEYVDAARELMGSIDLDPASCGFANKKIKAKEFYTEKGNGLQFSWAGNVWLNPPYGRDSDNESNQKIWSSKLISEYASGNVLQAVMLVNAVPDRSWFHRLWDYPICFCFDRIKFYNETSDRSQPTHPSVLVYFGKQEKKFLDIFSKFGRIVLPRGEYSESIK